MFFRCVRALTTICFLVVSALQPFVTSSCPLNSDQDWLAGVNMRHEVNIDLQNIICDNSNDNKSCDPDDYDLITNAPQLTPLTISVHDVIVPIVSEEHSNRSIMLQQVADEELFLSCNFSLSTSFQLENVTNIRINRSGHFYFIVSHPVSWCESGARFTVTVREEDCTNVRPHQFCSGKGNCVAAPDDEVYTCKCCPEYIGRYCQERDGCHSNPCKNSGLCVDITEGLVPNTFQCLCPFGFKGQVCEEPFDPCDSSPCLNNGSCLTKGSSYECICQKHFSGTSCQNEPDPCSSNPCVHGICRSEHQDYQCFCYPGFGGGNCEFEYDECDSNPCMNGGICEDGIAGYSCHCPPGFKGNHCQIHGDLCSSDPCLANQLCVSRGDHYTCSCPDGFTGDNCETRYDPCQPSPCQNGGSCWLKYGSFYCACKAGYTGRKCQQKKHMKKILGNMLEKVEELERSDAGSGLLSADHVNMADIHNVYIATGTLLAAIMVVLVVVTVCHCIYKRPYNRFSSSPAKNVSLRRVSSSTALFQKGKSKKKLSSKDSTIDSIYDQKSREYCVETLDIPLISSMRTDDRI